MYAFLDSHRSMTEGDENSQVSSMLQPPYAFSEGIANVEAFQMPFSEQEVHSDSYGLFQPKFSAATGYLNTQNLLQPVAMSHPGHLSFDQFPNMLGNQESSAFFVPQYQQNTSTLLNFPFDQLSSRFDETQPLYIDPSCLHPKNAIAPEKQDPALFNSLFDWSGTFSQPAPVVSAPQAASSKIKAKRGPIYKRYNRNKITSDVVVDIVTLIDSVDVDVVADAVAHKMGMDPKHRKLKVGRRPL